MLLKSASFPALSAAKSEYESDIPGISNQISHMEDQLTGLENLTNNHVAKLDEINDNTTANFDDVNTRLDTLESNLETTNTSVTSLTERVIGAESKITDLDTTLASKADKSALDLKADKTYVDTKLNEKADKTTLTTLEIKVKELTFSIQSGLIDGTNDGDRFIWTSDGAYRVDKIVFQQSVIENTSATTTLMLKKVQSGTAITSGSDLLGTAVNLKTSVTANTTFMPTLHGTTANQQVASGDSIALDFTNTLTEYVGCVTIYLKKI